MSTLLFRACAFLVVFLLPTGGAAQLVLYDNFDSKLIDPSKWLDLPADPDIEEAVRQLVATPGVPNDRRLHLSQRAYSATTDDIGSSGGGFGLAFPVPSAVAEISFTVVVNSAQAVGCTSNPAEGNTEAEFRGNFFNTTQSPTSSIGDVQAVIGVVRSSADAGAPLTAHGFYVRCEDEHCGSVTFLDGHVLGSVQPGVISTLHLKWDQFNHRFIFQLNDQPEFVSTYTVSDSSPPFFSVKILNVDHVVPHCTTTPRPFTAIDAFFDDVFVNGTTITSAAKSSIDSSFLASETCTALGGTAGPVGCTSLISTKEAATASKVNEKLTVIGEWQLNENPLGRKSSDSTIVTKKAN